MEESVDHRFLNPERLEDLEATIKRLIEAHDKHRQDFVPIARFRALEEKSETAQQALATKINQEQLNRTTKQIEVKMGTLIEAVRTALDFFEPFPQRLDDLETTTKRLVEEHEKHQGDSVSIAKFRALEEKSQVLVTKRNQEQLNNTMKKIETKLKNIAKEHEKHQQDFVPVAKFRALEDKIEELNNTTKELETKLENIVEAHDEYQQGFVPIAKYRALKVKLQQAQQALATIINMERLKNTTKEIQVQEGSASSERETRDKTDYAYGNDDYDDMEDEDLSNAALSSSDYEMQRVDDEEMGDGGGFAVWLDKNGDLQSDLRDLDETCDRLAETWTVQKASLEEKHKKDSGTELEWVPVDHDTSKCLWSFIFGRTQYWSEEDPGNFACRACAYNQAICFGNISGRWEALPLPSKLTDGVSGVASMFVAKRARITKSRQARGLWPAG